MTFREAIIDLGAISRNVAAIRSRVGAEHTMVVVKANGYGHGAVQSARAALEGGADWLGVVDFAEARELRDAGISAPILAWIHGVDEDFAWAIDAGVDVGVHSAAQLERVAAASGVANVHIKVDSGLGRNGATIDDCGALFELAVRLERSGAVRVRGFFSHLANTRHDAEQVARFEKMLGMARAAGLSPDLVHIAATGGALSLPGAAFSMVRVGIGAYGLSPFSDRPAGVALEPAMRLEAEVVSVKRVPAGSGVSYNFDYVTERDSSLALVPLGYADGIPRQAANRAPVSLGGARFTVSGVVAMDQFVVDVGDAPVRVGDRAVLFGDPADGVPSASDWADAAGTINYEIVTRIGSRVARRYVS